MASGEIGCCLINLPQYSLCGLYKNCEEELKKLDSKVKRPANIFAFVLGILGALIMGAGMSLAMTDIGKIIGLLGGMAMLVGILIGIVGIVLISVAYPIYNSIIKKEREKIAPEIIRLTDELMK